MIQVLEMVYDPQGFSFNSIVFVQRFPLLDILFCHTNLQTTVRQHVVLQSKSLLGTPFCWVIDCQVIRIMQFTLQRLDSRFRDHRSCHSSEQTLTDSGSRALRLSGSDRTCPVATKSFGSEMKTRPLRM